MRPRRVQRTRSIGITATAVVGAAYAARQARAQLMRWGATPAELALALPGDDVIAVADLEATRAITVHAPASEVWPWLAQMGQGRGGFYSYDGLENLIGCDIHNADTIVPQWQQTAVGDEVRLAPQLAMQVVRLEIDRCLVLNGAVPIGDVGPPYDCTWAFCLHELGDGSTRLVMRERYGFRKWWAPLLLEPVEVVAFVMSRKMLHGIKSRAENAPRTGLGVVRVPAMAS